MIVSAHACMYGNLYMLGLLWMLFIVHVCMNDCNYVCMCKYMFMLYRMHQSNHECGCKFVHVCKGRFAGVHVRRLWHRWLTVIMWCAYCTGCAEAILPREGGVTRNSSSGPGPCPLTCGPCGVGGPGLHNCNPDPPASSRPTNATGSVCVFACVCCVC